MPSQQAPPAPQLIPQPPQLAASLSGLMHFPPQSMVGYGQMQSPWSHVLPTAVSQAFPQEPQLALSVSVFLQLPEQQMPDAPNWVTQLLLQAPQWFSSFESSTHLPPQSVKPAGHLHVPDTHVLPPVQTLLQLPQ